MNNPSRTFRFKTETFTVEVESGLRDGVFRTEARDSERRMTVRDCWRIAPAEVRDELKLLLQLEGCDASGAPVLGDDPDEAVDKGVRNFRGALLENLRNGMLREVDALARNAVPFHRIEEVYHTLNKHIRKVMENRDTKKIIPVLDELQEAAHKAEESYSSSVPVLGVLHLRSIRSKLAKVSEHFGDSARFIALPVLDDSTKEATTKSCARIKSYAGGLRAGLMGRAIVTENLRGRVATGASASLVDDVVMPAVLKVWNERAAAAMSILAKPSYVSELLMKDEIGRPVPGMDTDSFIVTYAGRFFGDEIGSTLEAVLADMPVGEDEARAAATALRGLNLKHSEVATRIDALVGEIEERIAEVAPASPTM